MRIVPTRRWRIEPEPLPTWWSVHTHSKYSVNDAMPSVQAMVNRAVELGQPALGITDHGNMAASVELYQAATKAGIAPFPGSELYYVPDTATYRAVRANRDKATKVKSVMYHLGVVAYTSKGYENLVTLSTATHRNHHYKPLADNTLLAQLAEDGRTEGLAVTTGCFFGYLAQSLLLQGEDAALKYLYMLQSWFPDNVYAEIQNHNIIHPDGSTDSDLCDAIVGLADKVGLPVVCTQDSHYLLPTDRADHDGLKRMVAWGDDADDAVFPGDGFQQGDIDWLAAHHDKKRLQRGCAGLADLLAKHTLEIPVLDHYRYSVPQVVDAPQIAMTIRAQAALEGMFAPHQVPKKYDDRLTEELRVIETAQMAGYMMLVAQVADWMRSQDIMFHTRGSAAGSIVCWLLGISNVDPIVWKLRFERFLSKDRTKPPDIDLDVAHDRRDELLAMLNTRFTAHQIGTWSTYSLNDTTDIDGETQRGSLRVRYFSAARKHNDGVITIPGDDLDMLFRLSQRELLRGMGTNAAGIVLTSTPTEFEKLVPMAWMARAGSRGGFVTQYSKDQIEALGLVKLDVLGLRTLTVLDRTMRLLGLPISMISDIEFRDAETFKLIRGGHTEGIFQLEGLSTMRGLRELHPGSINDVIAAMALFRPATMNTGATRAFIDRKHGKAKLPQRHELIMSVTKETHGIMLYQEQVIEILRRLGMDADNLTAFLKAVKASNSDIGSAGVVIESYMSWIGDACERIGMSEVDQDYLTTAIAGFSAYGFNRAHATVYGIAAYRAAYLAACHSLEFHTALLGVASDGDAKKETRYLAATMRRGITVLPAVVNASGATYTIDEAKGSIRRGLASIKGVGGVTAAALAEAGPFDDLDDLVSKAAIAGVSGHKEYDGDPRSLTGILSKLYESGALTTLTGEC